MTLDPKFWNGTRWDGHAAFNTVDHEHVSCYSPAPGHKDCDLMVVGCADGRWYVEDIWGVDAAGHDGVWNSKNQNASSPQFFTSKDLAVKHAVAVVAKVAGVPAASVA